jgi:hypothetical protein
MARVTKEQGINISASVFVSWLTIGAAFWLVAKPILVASVSTAMAEDIKQTVQQEIAPINAAFVALLQTNIANTRRKIARLEFKRDQPPNGDWTAQDSEDMVNLQLELSSSESALAALTVTNTS